MKTQKEPKEKENMIERKIYNEFIPVLAKDGVII